MHYPTATAALSALTIASLAAADPLQNCVSGKICYTVAVPSASASSATGGDIYFQLQAPTTYTWAALGQGGSMTGANIFVMYADGTGNVTISPRTGTGHTQPKEDATTQLTLLAGSGVDTATGLMTANVKCANCQSWSGGTMDLASSSTNWIAAWKSGDPLDSTDTSAAISKHDDLSQFTFDLTKATIQDDANPFAGAAKVSASSSGGSGGAKVSMPTIIAVHGVIMALLFVVTWPAASLLMPILGKWLVHAIFQMTNFVLMWVGYGLGVYAANGLGIGLSSAHTLIGTIVCWAMAIQPILGWFHHKHYLKHKARGPISHGHIWYGRSLMLLGGINVGLGLQLVGASSMLVTLYAIVVSVMGALYISVKLFKFMMARNLAQMQQRADNLTFSVKDPRWDGSVHQVEMNTYGVGRGQQI